MSDLEAKIAALAERGATEGERAAARSALVRLRQAASSQRAELERAVGFGWRPEQHAVESAQHRATMDRLDTETYDDDYIPL